MSYVLFNYVNANKIKTLTEVATNLAKTNKQTKMVGDGFITQPAVLSGSGRLFRTIATTQNRTEPPVNRCMGFEAVPRVNL